jgi:hypothetical protein
LLSAVPAGFEPVDLGLAGRCDLGCDAPELHDRKYIIKLDNERLIGCAGAGDSKFAQAVVNLPAMTALNFNEI